MIADIFRTCAVLALAGKIAEMLDFIKFVREMFAAAKDQELLDKIYDKAAEITAKEDAALAQ